MPVMLVDDRVDEWLLPRQADAPRKLLVPAAEDLLAATPVSTRANSVRNDAARRAGGSRYSITLTAGAAQSIVSVSAAHSPSW